MPLHDWTDERDWDSVHPFWLAYFVEWVQPRLPEGYKGTTKGGQQRAGSGRRSRAAPPTNPDVPN